MQLRQARKIIKNNADVGVLNSPLKRRSIDKACRRVQKWSLNRKTYRVGRMLEAYYHNYEYDSYKGRKGDWDGVDQKEKY